MSDTLVITVVGALLSAIIMLPFVLRQRKLEASGVRAEEEAIAEGVHIPATLHPVINVDLCIGTANCIPVCPEGDVLALSNGQAKAIGPARCIGHGLCERSCPVGAIQLVFGTEKRGVELPRIKQNFETNVPGIYIVGELGGMGLIRNAFEQGRQCIEGIVKEGAGGSGEMLDVIIVGCGPAGLSASLHCKHRGLSFRTIEREDIGGTVRHYPRKKLVMTAPIKVPGFGKLNFREINKEDLIDLWSEMVAEASLSINTGETVTGITKLADGGFAVATDRGVHEAKRVILAIGRRGTPRTLGVPGEEQPKVIYSLREPEVYSDDRILVVGGGDSAVEAALALSESRRNEVTISYRRDRFSRIKPKNREKISAAIEAEAVEVLWETAPTSIGADSVQLQTPDGDLTIPNDVVSIFVGGVLPTRFLTECGIQIDVKFGRP